MVETQRDPSIPSSTPLHYKLVEYTLISKTGNDEDCEDALYIGPHFVAVIDGVTSKTERRWDGKTGGRVGASTLRDTFDHIAPDATARQAVDALTTAIKSLYEHYDVLDLMRTSPVERAVASLVIVSLSRREIWFVGDCQCLLNGCLITDTKAIDDITANARSAFLEAEVCAGKTIQELLKRDTGREFIVPLLERQMLFQNNPSAGQYWFPVIDGFEVPDEGIQIIPLSEDITTVVLASDGYPHLKHTLESSEQTLQEILRDDPLLFREYKSTKGMKEGDISFDDRTYVKLQLIHDTEVELVC